MGKKELGLVVLLLVVGGVTAVLNPLFLSGVNLLDMANLIGLFGIFSIGEGMVIITGGIDLSVGSMFALLGVVFIDLLTNRGVPWPPAIVVIIVAGILLGALQGFLVAKARAAAVRRHALRSADLSRRGAVLHGRRHEWASVTATSSTGWAGLPRGEAGRSAQLHASWS